MLASKATCWVALLLTCCIHLVAQANEHSEDGWEAAMNQALRLEQAGYIFLAISQLEALQDNHPDTLRLKLELAALYLKINQLDKANDYITTVLADPNLPVRVRINAQVLQLNIQTAQTNTNNQLRTHLAFTSGYEADQNSGYTSLTGGLRLSRPLNVLDLNGRAVPTQLFTNVAALARHRYEQDEQSGVLNAVIGVSAGTDRFRLTNSLGYRLSSELEGTLLALDLRIRPSGYDWTLLLSNQWLRHTDGVNRTHRLGWYYQWTPVWQLQGYGRFNYRTDTNEDETATQWGLAGRLAFTSWRWQTQLDYEVEEDKWSAETEVLRNLGAHWQFGGSLGTDLTDFPQQSYGELLLRWSK